MKTNPLQQRLLMENSASAKVTRKMMRERAVDLAAIEGHSAHHVSKSNWEQAKWELTTGREIASKKAPLNLPPESGCWRLLPVSAPGQKMPVISEDNEDEEGPCIVERLADKSVVGAEHEQVHQGGLKRNL